MRLSAVLENVRGCVRVVTRGFANQSLISRRPSWVLSELVQRVGPHLTALLCCVIVLFLELTTGLHVIFSRSRGG